LRNESGAQDVENLLDFAAHRHRKLARPGRICAGRLVETGACAADREALLV